MLAGIALALVFAAVAIGARANQIITGTAITLGAIGLTGTVYRQAYGVGGAGLDLPTLPAIPVPGLASIPVVGEALFRQPAPTYLALLVLPLAWWFLFRTRVGLGAAGYRRSRRDRARERSSDPRHQSAWRR